MRAPSGYAILADKGSGAWAVLSDQSSVVSFKFRRREKGQKEVAERSGRERRREILRGFSVEDSEFLQGHDTP
jgi:hypothetical protein